MQPGLPARGGGCVGRLRLPLLLLVCLVRPALHQPLTPSRTTTDTDTLDGTLQAYLTRFGWLGQSAVETGELRTEESVRTALRRLQAFAGLRDTGRADEATRRLLVRPRCGVPDLPQGAWDLGTPAATRRHLSRPRRYTLQGLKWDHTNLTWSLRTKRLEGGLSYSEVRRVLGRALAVWAQHSRLTFTELDSDQADIVVRFERGYHGDGYPFDGRGQILAHAFFPNSGRGGDAHFDQDELWITDDRRDADEGTSLFLVAAHEFGHSLGLSHSSVEGALMFPWYQGLKADFQLPDDDRHGIQQMYGAREDRMWGRRPEWRPPATTSPPPTITTTTERPTRQQPPPRRYPHHNKHRQHYPSKKPHHRHHRPTVAWWPPPQQPPTTAASTTVRSTTTATRGGPPDTCDTSYDAVSVIRRETFIFKDAWLWRIGERGLLDNYPAEIVRMWRGLPANLSRVDAVYERADGRIAFFIGRLFYLHDGRAVLPGYPRSLTTLGLPAQLERVDAALVWSHNGRTYLYSGTMYWRLDERDERVEPDYPRDMSMWRGVGYNVDAAFQWKDGRTYFFKGTGYWRFHDLRMHVEHEEPKPSAPFWMGCPREAAARSDPSPPQRSPLEATPAPDVTAAAAPQRLLPPLLLPLLLPLSVIPLTARRALL